MAKYLLVALSNAKPGRDDDYNFWYDTVHLADVCALPGVISGRRFEAHTQSPVRPEANYLALYEIEAEDPSIVLAELHRRAQAGEMALTDALDASSAKLMLFRAR
jgi:hypothetical protein